MAFLLNPLSPSQENVAPSIVQFKLQQNTGSSAKRVLQESRKEGEPSKDVKKQEKEEVPKKEEENENEKTTANVASNSDNEIIHLQRGLFQSPKYKISNELRRRAINPIQFEEEFEEKPQQKKIPPKSKEPQRLTKQLSNYDLDQVHRSGFQSPKLTIHHKLRKQMSGIKFPKCELFQSPQYIITDELRNSVAPIFPVLKPAEESEMHPDISGQEMFME